MPQKARPPLSTSSVATALASTPGARKVTGVTSVPSRRPVPRPASRPRVTNGSGIGSQARSTCGIWIRWSISATPSKPASAAALVTAASQAAGSSPHGNREICRTKPSRPGSGRSGPASARCGGAGCGSGGGRGRGGEARLGGARGGAGQDHVPALGGDLGRYRGHPPQLAVQDGGGHRPVPRPVAGPALRRAGLQQHRDRGQAHAPGQFPLRPAAGRIQPERVHHRGQAAAQPGRDDLVEQAERVRGGGQVMLTAADDAAQLVRGDDLGGPVAGRCPGGFPRPGRPDQDDQRRVRQTCGRLWHR